MSTKLRAKIGGDLYEALTEMVATWDKYFREGGPKPHEHFHRASVRTANVAKRLGIATELPMKPDLGRARERAEDPRDVAAIAWAENRIAELELALESVSRFADPNLAGGVQPSAEYRLQAALRSLEYIAKAASKGLFALDASGRRTTG